MIQGHGGDIYHAAKVLGCIASEIVDMSSNVGPLGLPPGLGHVLETRWEEVLALPEVDSRSLGSAFAASTGLRSEQVLAGNGTTEFIFTVPAALGTKKALIVGPTYADYADVCRAYGIDPLFWLAVEEAGFQPDLRAVSSMLAGVDTVFVCNPNNPTGSLVPAPLLQSLIQAHPTVRFVVDESYLPFVPDWEALSLAGMEAENVIVLQSFSKIFAIPGLRLGFVIAAPEIVRAFLRFKQPWSVNRLSQIAGVFLLSQKAFVQKTSRFVQTERDGFLGQIKGLETLSPFPSVTHFVLFRLNGVIGAGELKDRLAEHKILIRDCSNFQGLSDRFVRIALKAPEANRRCAEALTDILS